MAEVLFVVDHIFRESKDGTIFTMGGKFPYSAWETYLHVFRSLVVMSRVAPLKLDETSSLSVASGNNVQFVALPAKRGISRITGLMSLVSTIRHQVKNAQCLVARLPSESGNIAVHYARKYGVPYMVEVVACPWDSLWNLGTITGRAYAPIAKMMMQQIVREAPRVRYVTDRFLQNRYPTRGDWHAASNVMLRSSAMHPGRSRSIASAHQVRFGTTAALHHMMKGVDTAIEALSYVRDQRPAVDFRYEVLGEGDPARLRAVADRFGLGSKVIFVGTKPAGDAVFSWLDAIDVYLQPSFQEGLPRATIEAMSRGCLAIGSTAGGIPELLERAWLHAPGDARELARLIISLLDQNEGVQKSMSARNIEIAEKYRPDRLRSVRIEGLESLRSAIS